MEARLRKNESSENLIKRFMRKLKKDKLVEEILNREFYKKPSQIRREAKAKSIAKQQKENRKERLLEKRIK